MTTTQETIRIGNTDYTVLLRKAFEHKGDHRFELNVKKTVRGRATFRVYQYGNGTFSDLISLTAFGNH